MPSRKPTRLWGGDPPTNPAPFVSRGCAQVSISRGPLATLGRTHGFFWRPHFSRNPSAGAANPPGFGGSIRLYPRVKMLCEALQSRKETDRGFDVRGAGP